jgi:type IV pilus assembly protein PilC
MRIWEYLALEKGGNFVHGSLEARDLELAYHQLRRIFPCILCLREPSRHRGERRRGALVSIRVPSEIFVVCIRQLATLIAAGVPAPRALLVLAEGENLELNMVLVRMYGKLIAGSSISKAMRENPGIFSEVFTSVVEIGEVSGKLEIMLNRLADLHEVSWRLKRRLLASLTYPAILAASTLILLGVFMLWIFPLIQPVFLTVGGEMPALTKALLFIMAALQSPWFLGPLAAGVAASVLALRFRSTIAGFIPGFHRAVDDLILKIPVLGKIIEKATISRVLYSLATMLDAGVYFGEALKTINKVVSNEVLTARFEKVWKAVLKGSSLHAALTKFKVLPQWVIQMIRVGEESGTLDAMMRRAARIYQNEVEYFLDNAASALEPIMLCLMGVVVGLVTVATFLPVIQLLNEI